MMNLFDKEVEKLKKLYKDGFVYLTRNRNGALFTYRKWDKLTLVKGKDKWSCEHYCKEVNRSLFKFITWEDKEPTYIERLLNKESE